MSTKTSPMGRWSTFSYSSHTAQLKTLDITHKANIKTLKGGEKVGQLGTLGRKEQHNSLFLGFSCCLKNSRFGAKKATNPEMPMGAHQKRLQQKPKEQEWEGLVDRKLMCSDHSTLAKHHRKKLWPHPYQCHQRSGGSLDFHSHPAVTRSPPALCVKEGRVNLDFSSQLAVLRWHTPLLYRVLSE